MKKSFFLLIFVALILNVSAQDFSPREMIVKLTQPRHVMGTQFGLSDLDHFIGDRHAREIKPFSNNAGNQFFTVRFERDLDWDQIRSMRPQFDGVEYIQPNYINKMYLTPNDPSFPNQQFDTVNIPQGWDITTGSDQIILAVVDSGIHFDHPDLQTNIFINEDEIPDNGIDDDQNGYIDDWRGWDFADAPELADVAVGDYLERDNDPTDENNHGTHVAGIIAADNNNHEGICGVCYNVKILVLRAGFPTTQGQGYLQDDDCAAAIMYAADMGANVLNMSWGDTNYSQVIADACQYAYDHGTILVASAGNEGTPVLSYPAALSTTISVGSVDQHMELASFSSHGPDLDLVAPGSNVLSTYSVDTDDYYREMSGTSMSSPFVCGAIALLLSHQPGLNFEQVRSRLLSSTIDLGEPGFDNEYGYGLLDVREMLLYDSEPYIQITYPEDNQGITSAFEVMGTVQSDDFFRYCVMYTDKENPQAMDWKDVVTHQNTPVYYFDEVTDGILASFVVPDHFPDGEYRLRIQLDTIDGHRFDARRIFRFDTTPPNLIEESVTVIKRYNKEMPVYYLQAVYDETVNVQIDVESENGSSYTFFGNYADSINIIRIPDEIPDGSIDVQITATNSAGISSVSNMFEDLAVIDRSTIDVHGFVSSSAGKAMITIPIPGQERFVGMDLDEGYGPVHLYDFTDSSPEVLYSFHDEFKPVHAGDSDGTGTEILGLNLETMTLYETPQGNPGNYPTIPLWNPLEATYGGLFGDLNNDGRDEIFLVQTYSVSRVIRVYRRDAWNVFTQIGELFNLTGTTERNTIVPSLKMGDFDNDGKKDLLAADTDGDIMIYEFPSPEDGQMVWADRLPVPNTYQMAIGDFDGSRTSDFCVGGYRTDTEDPAKTFWYFRMYRGVSNNLYEPFGSIGFDAVESQNAIEAADLDGDGDDELIFSLSPSVYIVDYIDGEFVPVWKGDSFRTFQISVLPELNGNPDRILINSNALADSLVTAVITPGEYFPGPPTPENFTVHPLNDEHVSLLWNDADVDSWRVYRRIPDGPQQMIASVEEPNYIAENLIPGITYEFAVSAVDNDFMPPESRPTLWKEVIPDLPPSLSGEIRLIAPHRMELAFDRPLHGTSSQIGNFTMYRMHKWIDGSAEEIALHAGHPTSSVLSDQETHIVLTFSTNLQAAAEEAIALSGEVDSLVFEIEIRDVKGATGVPFSSGSYACRYTQDLEPPFIDHIEVVTSRRIGIHFNEAITAQSASNIHNYELKTPGIDSGNSIASVEHDESTVWVNFQSKMLYSSQSYGIVARNIFDLSGNQILNSGNSGKFSLETITDLSHMIVYPNPLYTTEFDKIWFDVLPFDETGSIAIYNLSGDIVFKESIGPFNENQYRYAWYPRNAMARELSSGVYYYIVRMGGDVRKGSIAIIR